MTDPMIEQAKSVIDQARDPAGNSLLAYAWVFALSGFGGCVSFIQKVNRGLVRAWNLTEFVGEIVISVFAGLVAFYLGQAAGFDPPLNAALVAVSGHMGTRAIFLIENAISKRINKS